MAELEVLVSQVGSKDGISKSGKPFTRYFFRDGAGEFYSTFNKQLGEILPSYEGKQARITFEQDGQFRNLETIRPADGQPIELAPDAVDVPGKMPAPQFGDGSYVKGRENPDTQRAIAASVALKEAVATFAHTIPASATPTDAAERVLPLAASYLNFLLRNAGLDPDEGIPF